MAIRKNTNNRPFLLVQYDAVCSTAMTFYSDMAFSTDCSFELPEFHPIARNYVEEEEGCPFCGNMSELRDAYGNCVSCGAPRKPPKK